MKTKKIVLVCSMIESMMHGVVYFTLNGKTLSAKYTDGSEESVTAKPSTISVLKKHYLYQNENGPEGIEPNTFLLVTEIQSARKQEVLT